MITRKQRAAAMLRRLEDGPGFSPAAGENTMSAQQAVEQYRRWVQSWVIEDVKLLVPELRLPGRP